MVYGGGMLFHAARSRVLMPLPVAIRYRLSPRWTTVVAPYLGVDPPAAGMRVTVLLAQAASMASAAATARVRTRCGQPAAGDCLLLMRLVCPNGRRRRPVCGSTGEPLPQP